MKTHTQWTCFLSSGLHCTRRSRARGALKLKVPPFAHSGNKIGGGHPGARSWWMRSDKMERRKRQRGQMPNLSTGGRWPLASQGRTETMLQEQEPEAELTAVLGHNRDSLAGCVNHSYKSLSLCSGAAEGSRKTGSSIRTGT